MKIQKNTDFSGLIESAKRIINEEVDAKKIIKDLAKSYGGSNEEQGKMVQLLRGLAFSDDPASNKFMKALDKWTTEYANKIEESTELDEEIAGWIAFYNNKQLEIIKGKDADNLLQAKEYAIKELKVPKSKRSLVSVQPAYND